MASGNSMSFPVYKKLHISGDTPQIVREQVIRKSDMFLREVHEMFGLALANSDTTPYFSIVLTLLVAVNGISELVWPRSSSSQDRTLKALLMQRYPWDREGVQNSEDKTKNADELVWMRDNLVHQLGLDSVGSQKKGIHYSQIHKHHAIVCKPNAKQIAKIESDSNTSEVPWTATVTQKGADSPKVDAVALYRGVRYMVEQLTFDKVIMRESAGYLQHLGFPDKD
jgi:hypothetical protein